MPPTNYTTFRVRGIPAGTTQEGLSEIVTQAISCHDAAGVQVRSLAGDASRPREMVATVTFANIPEELSDACGDWTIKGPQDVTLAIDTHFHGCTTLYCPPADEWKLDLIAISGLNGHAFGSFKKKNSSYMWLCDSLPRDISSCRIIIYGYDTRLQGSRSFQSLLDIGKKFQTAIRQVRHDAKKSLILLSHSLGGLVVKEAISFMRSSSIDADKLTFAAIRALIFFGVPNQGMDISSLIPMVGDQSNRGFLHELDHNSHVLRTQAKDFSAVISDLRCEILNFYETQESPTARQNEFGVWSMSGPPAVLVNIHSATHGRPDDSKGHRVFPIDCDHSNLIKFGSTYDEAYATVAAFLQEIDKYGASPTNTMTKTQEACCQSLGFCEQYHRMDSLEPAVGTCNWLTSHELFTEWLRSSKGFLWIRGKPGSGKSMAMRHALEHIKASTSGIVASFFIHGHGTELQKTTLGIYRSLLHQVYPYSPDSFSNLTTRYEEYLKKAGNDGKHAKWSWMKGEIRQNLFRGLQKLCKNDRVIILVDALDEAGEEQARAIFKDLDTLVDSLGDDSTCQLSLCVACRHYPDISSNSGKTIVMEDLNSSDIEHVLNSQLDPEDVFDVSEKHQLKSAILGKSEGIFQWTSLVTETVIRMRQKGDSFKVAMRNVDRVPRDLGLLYKALLEPRDEQEHELKQRTRLFQWVTLAAEPLTPRELQHALAIHSKMTYRLVCEYEQSDDFIAERDFETKVKNLSKGLIQIKGSFQSGRTEFIHQSIPDFLLGHRGLELLSGLAAPDSIRFGHFELSMSCFKYLFIDEIRRTLSEITMKFRDLDYSATKHQFPLLVYAWRHWIFHAVSGNELKSDGDDELCRADLIRTFGWPEDQAVIALWARVRLAFGSPLDSWIAKFRPFVRIFRLLDPDPVQLSDARMWPCENASLIHLLALTGLMGKSTQTTMSSDLESAAVPWGNSFVTPLGYALFGQQKTIVQNLVASGVRVQYKTGPYGQSPLYLASAWGDPEVVSLLLRSGSNVNHRETNTWTPLHVAAYTGNVAAIRVLINAGAKVNFRPISWDKSLFPNFGESPLHLAALNGKVEAIRQLVNLGANVNLKSLIKRAPPLLSAIAGEDIETVRLLLELGADVHTRDVLGRSAIHYVLLSKYSSPGWRFVWDDDLSPRSGNLNILELLIQLGCDINGKDRLGISPLYLSAELSSANIVDLLLSHGADPNASTNVGDRPIHCAAEYNTEALRALLHAGCNVHVENRVAFLFGLSQLGSPLHVAVAQLDLIRVQLLLQAGSNVNMVNRKGETPLGLALRQRQSYSSQFPIVKLLLEAGAESRTVRNAIYFTGRPALALKLLVEAGLDPNTRDDEGETALFWVVRSQKLSRREKEPYKMQGVKLLLRSGADPSITNWIGRTALSYATRNGDNCVAELFREHGAPEGVWRRYSKFSFVRRRVDKLSGKSSRYFKRESSWYLDTAERVVSLLDRRFIIHRFLSDSSSDDESLDDESSDDGPSDNGSSDDWSSEYWSQDDGPLDNWSLNNRPLDNGSSNNAYR